MKKFMHKITPFKVVVIFILGIFFLVGVMGFIIWYSFSNVVGKDFYTIGDVEIPSISFVLQEKRSAKGFSVNKEPGKSIKTIYYRATPNPLEDLTAYATYLQDDQGFILIDPENEGTLMQKMLLYKEHPDLQTVILVELHCNVTEYCIVLVKQPMG